LKILIKIFNREKRANNAVDFWRWKENQPVFKISRSSAQSCNRRKVGRRNNWQNAANEGQYLIKKTVKNLKASFYPIYFLDIMKRVRILLNFSWRKISLFVTFKFVSSQIIKLLSQFVKIAGFDAYSSARNKQSVYYIQLTKI